MGVVDREASEGSLSKRSDGYSVGHRKQSRWSRG